VDFALDESQRAVVDLAGSVLRRETGSTAWKALADAGLLGLAVSERWGGAGLGALETALVLTEVGRQAATLPALATLALGVLPVATAGTPEQQERVLPGVVAGDLLLAGALNEPGRPLPDRPDTAARPDGEQLVVSGRKIGVGHAAGAHRILVPARIGDGVGVLLVDPTADGVTLTATPASGPAPEFALRLENVVVPTADLLGGDRTGAVAAALVRFGLLGAAALGDGLLAGALALTTSHIGSREQFGRPLAAFQGVALQIADVYVAARTLHLAALSAGWRLASGRDATEDLAVAGYWLAEELPAALHICHHLHGGLGLDVSYPLHRYSAQVRDLARFVGGADDRLSRLGDLVAEGA
jgi:hypothetical protein